MRGATFLLGFLVLLGTACVRPRVEPATDDFLLGLRLRDDSPQRSRSHLELARRKAREILASDPAPGERIESYAILARAALELERPSEAEIAFEDGRKFFEEHDVDRIWRGDRLALHVMKGDYYARLAWETLRSFGGETSDSRESDEVVRTFRAAIAEYLLGEDKGSGAVRSFVLLRLARAYSDIARVCELRSALHDVVYMTAAKKALNSALEIALAETESPGPYYDNFRALRRRIEDKIAVLKKVMRN